MAATRGTTNMMMLARSVVRSALCSQASVHSTRSTGAHWRVPIGYCLTRCMSTKSSNGGKKPPGRMVEVQRLLYQAEERYTAGGGIEPIPKISIDHVSISYAGSGGPGGQNVNKVNSKVEMRFNVKTAHWLSESVRERIMLMEKSRINKDGEILIASTKTRTQAGNADDALAKLRVFTNKKKKLQEIIDAASCVPPPPSQEIVKKIEKLAALGKQKRLAQKKAVSKALRRSRDRWN